MEISMLNARRRLKKEGVSISLRDMLAMLIRGTLTKQIVDALIEAHHAGLDVDIDHMEAHLLANGDVLNVLSAAKAIKGHSVTIPWNALYAIDLADHDALDSLVAEYIAKNEVDPSVEFGEICREHWTNKKAMHE